MVVDRLIEAMRELAVKNPEKFRELVAAIPVTGRAVEKRSTK
jgi:hypothetical protein